jgi:hypothetical protein
MSLSEIFDSPKGEHVYNKRTICEVHRELYDVCVINLIDDNPQLLSKLIKLLEEAFMMGVKMNLKLIENKCGNDEWSENNCNMAEAKKIRNLRIQIMKNNRDILKKFNK